MNFKAEQKTEPKPLFLERMKKLLGDGISSYLNSIKNPVLNSIRCNTLKISPENLKKRLEGKGWKILQHFKEFQEIIVVEGKYANSNDEINGEDDSKTKLWSSNVNNKGGDNLKNECYNINPKKNYGINNIRDLSPGELGRALEHMLGYYYIQEISSMLPVLALQPEQDEIILDLAAAPGSKTTQIASAMKNTGTIIANDISLGRIKILSSNLERCGVTNTIITRKDGAELCSKLKENNFMINKILLDAPCSGEGTILSNPKTAQMWNIQTVKNLSGIQKRLISNALEFLKPGGVLVYSTCTHAPEENEEVVDFALKKFGNKISIEKISLPLKCREGITDWENKKYSEELKNACRIYPQDNNTEGFFIAKMRKLR